MMSFYWPSAICYHNCQWFLINPPNRSSLTLLLVFSFCQKILIKQSGSVVVGLFTSRWVFIESVQDIPEVQDSQLIELLGSVPGIDVGEQLLLASCIENPEAIFMTGDRRCLNAIVANQPALAVVHQRLLDAVVTFESSSIRMCPRYRSGSSL